MLWKECGQQIVIYFRRGDVTGMFRFPVTHAGNGCGDIVGKQSDVYYFFDLCKGHVLFPDATWVVVVRLWPESTMIIWFGLCKRSFLHSNIRGVGSCGEIEDRKFDGYFGCGICQSHFVFCDNEWLETVVKDYDQKIRCLCWLCFMWRPFLVPNKPWRECLWRKRAHEIWYLFRQWCMIRRFCNLQSPIATSQHSAAKMQRPANRSQQLAVSSYRPAGSRQQRPGII